MKSRYSSAIPGNLRRFPKPEKVQVMAITLDDEIKDLKREIALREKKYPEWRNAVTDPRKVAEMLQAHTHQLACARATLARLQALIPQQTALF